MKKIERLHIFALAAQGKGISGGDRIFIELARRWSKKFPITIYVAPDGLEMCKRQNLNPGKNLRFEVAELGFLERLGFLGSYISRIWIAIRWGFFLTLSTPHHSQLIYNASEFWMDSLPCFILKLRYSAVRWIASWYQTAPNPLLGYTELGKRNESYKLSAFFYWLAQFPIKPLISKFADKVIVNNDDERKNFPGKETVVLIGAVPLESIKKILTTNRRLLANKKYDAVFQGRFHPQKGVVELVDIWRMVVDKKPDATLAMIGDGPLMKNVKARIKDLRLEKNIELFGFVFDGYKKYRIFAQSKIVVHPAFYDSGGMASAEAMAFGLPCVGFNLKAYESYYPKGMVKVKIGDPKAFSNEIVRLLGDNTYRKKIGSEATKMIEENWSWDKRAGDLYSKLFI